MAGDTSHLTPSNPGMLEKAPCISQSKGKLVKTEEGPALPT